MNVGSVRVPVSLGALKNDCPIRVLNSHAGAVTPVTAHPVTKTHGCRPCVQVTSVAAHSAVSLHLQCRVFGPQYRMCGRSGPCPSSRPLPTPPFPGSSAGPSRRRRPRAASVSRRVGGYFDFQGRYAVCVKECGLIRSLADPSHSGKQVEAVVEHWAVTGRPCNGDPWPRGSSPLGGWGDLRPALASRRDSGGLCR